MLMLFFLWNSGFRVFELSFEPLGFRGFRGVEVLSVGFAGADWDAK